MRQIKQLGAATGVKMMMGPLRVTSNAGAASGRRSQRQPRPTYRSNFKFALTEEHFKVCALRAVSSNAKCK